MNKNKATAIIEETFDKKFNKEQFIRFVQNLLNDIDVSENKYHGNLIKESLHSHIVQYTHIGKYTDPNGIALDVLAIEVQDNSKLDKARTSLRNFVIDHLEKFEKDYALAAFYSKTDYGRNWRFSFVKLEHHTSIKNGKIKQEKEFTPARRYSFLVGEDEKSHTAKRQLLPLLQNVSNNPTIEDIEKAFSIEVVTDEFFRQYKELYLHISEHLNADNQIKSVLETAGTDIPRFTKKLLGQIVFLYFLQKKGWLGVPKNGKWGTGLKNFLQSLYDKAHTDSQNFFNTCLRYLFYEDNYYSRLDCRIPFFNGLFIDIARLRLWLSLVVDEEDFDNIEALPNLDYKIVCGNSLIGLPENAMHDLNVESELEILKETFFAENNELRKKELRYDINHKFDVLSMSLFTQVDIPDWYFASMIN